MTGPGEPSGPGPEPVPVIATGTVLRLAARDWRYGRHPLILRVEKVRADISVFYQGRWVWISGEQLAPDLTPLGHLDALVRVAALPVGPDRAEPTSGWCENVGRSDEDVGLDDGGHHDR